MAASDVAVLELVRELCGSADAAGAPRVPKSKKCLSFGLQRVGAKRSNIAARIK